jgi:hypothetical protein
MKKLVAALLAGVLVTGSATARPHRAAIGTILGATTGVAVAHHRHHIRREIAVPVLALAGGLIGNYLDRDAWCRRCKAPANVEPTATPDERDAPRLDAAPDLQPGVDLVKISILNPNGIRTDVPILRVGDRFLGPRGEEYKSLPTSQILAERYGKLGLRD